MRPLLRAFRRAGRTWVSVIGALLLASSIAAAVVGPALAPRSPIDIAIRDRLQAPNARHWFGTDQYGRDVLARALWGSRYSIGAAFTAVTLGTAAGGLLGLLGGYHG